MKELEIRKTIKELEEFIVKYPEHEESTAIAIIFCQANLTPNIKEG